MLEHIHIVPFIVATLVSMIPAMIWYTNKTFGPSWRRLTGINPKQSENAGFKPVILTLFANAVTVLVIMVLISIISAYFKVDSIAIAPAVGFVTWLAFSATTLATHNAFEQKPTKLTLINIGYQLVLFLLISLTIGLMIR